MRILITRPEPDAAALGAALATKGIDSLIEPMLSIRPVAGATIELTDIQGLLFTSANGIRAFASLTPAQSLTPARQLPVFAVGDATAAAARTAGFETVSAADGDVTGLAEMVRRRVDPAAGGLLHIAGSAVAGDLSGTLEADGYRVERRVLNASEATDS